MSIPCLDPELAQRVFCDWVDKNSIAVPETGRFRFARDGARGSIYFALEPEGPLKIGWSVTPIRRMRGQSLDPLVFVTGQGHFEEGRLHHRLRQFSVRQSTLRPNRAPEWFDRNSPVLLLARLLADAAARFGRAA